MAFASLCCQWHVQVLLDAGIKTADAIVLGSGPSVGAELEADARILAAVLQVSVGKIGGLSFRWQVHVRNRPVIKTERHAVQHRGGEVHLAMMC